MTNEELFENGCARLKQGDVLGALSCFEKAYAINKLPRIQSFLGVAIAQARGQVAEGARLCEDAIRQEPENSFHYLNLAKIYLRAHRNNDAILALRRGIACGDNEEIKALLEVLGIRRKPFFPFLPRKHFLNKYIGLLLSRLKLRRRPVDIRKYRY